VAYFLIICSKPSSRGLKSICWGESEGAWLWSSCTNFTDFLGFAMSVVSANWRALRTVVAKSTSLACSRRYCDISNDSRPSSKRRLRVMSLKSAEAEGQASRKSRRICIAKSEIDSVSACFLFSNRRMASRGSSSRPKRDLSDAQISL